MRKSAAACAIIIAATHGKAFKIQDVVQCQSGWCFDPESESCLPMHECDDLLSKKEQQRQEEENGGVEEV